MSIRIYLCPIVGDGLSSLTAFRAAIADFSDRHVAVIPSSPGGATKFNWALAAAFAADWTRADAQSTLARLYGTALPDTITDWPSFKAFLQSKTVADIPVATRQALNTLLTNHGIDTSQVTLSTTWWQILLGIRSQMDASVQGDGIAL